ncbi:GspE/PulE family protein [Calditerrivibrio nitroreducens]|uniref:Type II secretion system protein E n=1 Tax=Calditerrivibrio nitroreducens (strain DSM 19672 / NBRC 101217 / Yu37-1) TaxID=768670 RepID=E4TEJ3_CALNY|nr:GspE/PulE family protein [Calditerrivibrio nitroreducens]ADR18319.1 type II secretion system protein E [Calditerrivibrio nitroreducens DSM 19672]
MDVRKKIRIGELLKEKNLITEAQLKVALNEQQTSGKKLGEVLEDLGYVTEKQLLQVISEQLGTKIIKASDVEINPDLKKLIPENIARKLKVVPIKIDDKRVFIATNDPANVNIYDELERMLRKEVYPFVVTKDDLLYLLEKVYGTEDRLYKTAEDVTKKLAATREETLENLAEDTPVINLVDGIIHKAVSDRASDIHIEPDEDKLRIRYRIDGVLIEVLGLNRNIHPAIVSRIKIMSGMNIAEKRIPQDGRFKVSSGGRDVDFRVSTLPTNFGEKVVLRILDRSKALLELHNIGMDPHSLSVYESIVAKPYGIILISGPTGSGKTTTLYATLNKLNTPDKNIVTVEDPIEYNFRLINQVQTDETAGLTFANALRSILRQDPDIIMVGEIRDKETAEIAIQASLTGHLVLSTIHTNDAVSSVVRLVDMGIENFLVATSLIGVVGQRLVRKICEHCKQEYIPEPEMLERLKIKDNGIKFYRGAGCPECKYTGYSGRIGIYEVLKIDGAIKQMITKGKSVEEIRSYALKNGFKSMFDGGFEIVKSGITTIEELLRVTVISGED